jgi:hypothetical protein
MNVDAKEGPLMCLLDRLTASGQTGINRAAAAPITHYPLLITHHLAKLQ